MALSDDGAIKGGGLLHWMSARLFGKPDPVAEATRHDAQRRKRPKGLATMAATERVREAFVAMPPNETEARVIAALMRRPGATSAELGAEFGWAPAVWQMHFKLLCERRADYLWPSDLPDEPDVRFLGSVLADYVPELGQFRLKADVARVFRKLGIGGE